MNRVLESLCCTPEINVTLCVKYSSVKNKKIKHIKVGVSGYYNRSWFEKLIILATQISVFSYMINLKIKQQESDNYFYCESPK